MIHAELGEPGLAGVLEPPGVARRGDAVFVVAVDPGCGAVGVGGGEDRALVVRAGRGALLGRVRCGNEGSGSSGQRQRVPHRKKGVKQTVTVIAIVTAIPKTP